MDTIKAIIFDGDDTLWECGSYYRDAEEAFVEATSKRTGISEEICRNVLMFLDGLLAQMDNGFAKERFPQSFQASALALDAMANNVTPIKHWLTNDMWDDPDSITFAQRMYTIANQVYNQPFSIYDGIHEFLHWLTNKKILLFLNTKGADEVQNPKINDNNLRSYFDEIFVTLKKDTDHLQSILNEWDLNPEEVLCVGDSMVDDIFIPQSLGCKTVWISDHSPNNFKPSWAYEEQLNDVPTPDWWTPRVSHLESVLIENEYGHLSIYDNNMKSPLQVEDAVS